MSNVYTQTGEEWVIDAIDAALTAPHVSSGTGTVAAAKGDTALGAQVGSRVTGTKSQPTADVLRVVGTISYGGSFAITECGLHTASSGGVMLQRHVFAALNVANGMSIEFTIEHEQA